MGAGESTARRGLEAAHVDAERSREQRKGTQKRNKNSRGGMNTQKMGCGCGTKGACIHAGKKERRKGHVELGWEAQQK